MEAANAESGSADRISILARSNAEIFVDIAFEPLWPIGVSTTTAGLEAVVGMDGDGDLAAPDGPPGKPGKSIEPFAFEVGVGPRGGVGEGGFRAWA